jgi:hypothetical protein
MVLLLVILRLMKSQAACLYKHKVAEELSPVV